MCIGSDSYQTTYTKWQIKTEQNAIKCIQNLFSQYFRTNAKRVKSEQKQNAILHLTKSSQYYVFKFVYLDLQRKHIYTKSH